jgi:hypothetical protein
MKLYFKIAKLTTLIIFLLLLTSCDYIVNLKRTGDIITQEIEWNGASKIEICAPVRVIPMISNDSKIEIIGMDFIVNDFDLIQSEEKLVVEHKNINRIQENKTADLILYAPNFETITINAPCKIHCTDTLYVNKLNFVINGRGVNTSGNLILKGNNLSVCAYGISKALINLSGQVQSVYYKIEGGAKINAHELFTEKTEIVHKSYADCYISVSEMLNVKIYACGNVYYKGSPHITTEIIENDLFNATGKVISVK